MKINFILYIMVGHMTKLAVKKGTNFPWLFLAAKDKATVKKLKYIEELSEKAKRGEFSKSLKLISLKLGNLTICVQECDAWFSLIMYTEIFKEYDHALITDFNIKNAKIIVDLGANLGFYSMKMYLQNPGCKFILVEANPSVFAVLQKNIITNNLKNVYAINTAVADYNGIIEMKFIDQASALGGKYLGEIKKEQRKWIKDSMIKKRSIQCMRLENIFNDFNVDRVDILKIDIEQMEMDVLTESEKILNRIDRIVVEWHDYNTKNEIISFLTGIDFSLVLEERRDFGDLYFVRRSFPEKKGKNNLAILNYLTKNEFDDL